MQKLYFYAIIKLIFVLLLLSTASCRYENAKIKQNEIELHWLNYNFANQQLINHPESIKAPTLSFLNLLDRYPQSVAERAMELFLDKILVSDSSILQFTVDEVLEKYLYRADSPIRNENYYLTVVDCLINSQRLSEVDKIRFRSQKRIMMLNQVGSVAMNFDYINKDDRLGDLYDIEIPYLLIYFHHPDCYECKEMKKLIQSSPILNKALQNKQLVVLAVFTDNDKSLWQNTILPQEWINSYNIDQSIVQKNLYDLRAIPCLYLLDKDQRVIIKDGLLDEVLSNIEK